MRYFLAFSLMSSAVLLAPAAQQPPPKQPQQPRAPEGVQVHKDLAYVPEGHERQKLNLYVPKSDKPLPLVIWIHGGAWSGGNKERCPALPFVQKGFAVASLNYRLSHHATFPAQIEDCKTAIRWLRANAAKYNLDPKRFGAWGQSAGGHLVALLGTSGDVKELEGSNGPLDQSSRVQAVCDWCGPTDFLAEVEQSKGTRLDRSKPHSPEAKLIGGELLEHPEKAKAASPITYVSKDDPPFLIMHGEKDDIVPLQQSKDLAEALKKAGVPVKLHVVPGGGHGFGNTQLLAMVQQFFEEHLKK
jgi:acetyl esterase/lipase